MIPPSRKSPDEWPQFPPRKRMTPILELNRAAMRRAHFPNDDEKLVAIIPDSTRHTEYSAKRDFSETWYQNDDYRCFRRDCQALAEKAKQWKISRLLDGTTSLSQESRSRSSDYNSKQKKKERARIIAKLKIWSIYSNQVRGLEKFIHYDHGMNRYQQRKLHQESVLLQQDRLLDFQSHLPDFVANELSSTSSFYSASSSQLAHYIGIADAFACMEESDSRKSMSIHQDQQLADDEGRGSSLAHGTKEEDGGEFSHPPPPPPTLSQETTLNISPRPNTGFWKKNKKSPPRRNRPSWSHRQEPPNTSSARKTSSSKAA